MRRVACLSLTVLFLLPSLATAESQKPLLKRTENRQDCMTRDPNKLPLFGETHAHTSFSFDAYSLYTRNPPSDAYRYAKGEPIYITDDQGAPSRCAQLARPLDWAALTDHSEFFGALTLCGTEGSPAYNDPSCVAFRANPGTESEIWGEGLTTDPLRPPAFCGAGNEICQSQSMTLWTEVQTAAAQAYSPAPTCAFTSFIGYEWTSMPGYNNRHRNVIFRNEQVPSWPLSVFDTGNKEQDLWSKLREKCQAVAGSNCDVLTIPHNGNLSDGKLYVLPADANEAYAVDRSAWEPLSEIHQGKGNSECRTGVGTDDPECGFEQLAYHNLDFVEFGKKSAAGTAKTTDEPFQQNAFLRNVLKEGLADQKTLKANPFKLGFAGGTDTHSALPGGTDEGNFLGIHGAQTASDEGLLSQVEFNPGALTVAWAVENSRDAIFEALRRRETYATSGTRPVVRVFAGWDLPTGLCDSTDFAKDGYAHGVPMGADLPPRPAESTAAGPRFAVMASKDPGSTAPNPLPPGNCAVYSPGARLQRIEIVKGWVDAAGQTREKVYTVAGNHDLPADAVNPATCAPSTSAGKATLCSVWTDPEFNPSESAFYYARVLEEPTCRWSTRTCKSAGLDPFDPTACQTHLAQFSTAAPATGGPSLHDTFAVCCAMKPGPVVLPTEIPKVTQQRAWTSPVWYEPAAAASTKAKTNKTKTQARTKTRTATKGR